MPVQQTTKLLADVRSNVRRSLLYLLLFNNILVFQTASRQKLTLLAISKKKSTLEHLFSIYFIAYL